MKDNKKINILILGMSSNTGGIETFIYNMILKSDKEKFNFDFVFAGNQKMAFEDQLKELNCEIHRICPRNENRNKHISDLNKVISNKYDIIHIHLMTYSWYEPIKIAHKKHIKTIIHSHSTGVPKNEYKVRILDKLGRLVVGSYDFHRLACGKAAGKYMFDTKDFEVINNGISFDKFSFNENYRKEIRDSFNIDDSTTVLGCVAVFLPFKNHTFLIDVFNEYHKKNKNSKLILVGDGFTRKGIEEKVKSLNLSNDVVFTGLRRDVNKLYSSFDMFINTAIKEGFCISIVEAQINGLKCYVSNGSSDEIDISNHVDIIPLSKTPSDWSRIIENGDNHRINDIYKSISREYDADNSYKKMYKVYEDIASK